MTKNEGKIVMITKNCNDLNNELLLSIDHVAGQYHQSATESNLTSGAKARKRWKLLAEVLKVGHCKTAAFHQINNNNDDDYECCVVPLSSEKYQNLGLARLDLIDDEFIGSKTDTSSFFYCRASFVDVVNSPQLKLRILTNSVDGLHDLIGFNNTGNVRIWSSEEIMTYYCLTNKNLFENKSVVELGAGMTGLASFFVAKSDSGAKRILITDGNEKCVENLRFINALNSFPNGVCVETRRLVWSRDVDDDAVQNLNNRFDLCLAADCFFFENDENLFLNTVDRLLKPNGLALFFAPLRNGTFLKFVDSVRRSKNFEIRKISDDYCPQIMRRIKEEFFSGPNSKFDYNSVFPLMLEIQKIASYENFSAASDILVGGDSDKSAEISTTR